MKQRFMLFLMTLLFLLIVAPVSAQVSPVDVYNSAGKYMVETVPNPTLGDEWFIIALARGEYDVPANYFETYYNNLVTELKNRDGVLHNRKYTEYSRVILALSAIGKDATNVGGYNLVEQLSDFDKVVWQGVNGPIFALIAIDSWNYELPKDSTNSREKMIDYILSKQLADGGFALSGTTADPDMTAMAIQSLSTYKNRADVQAAIDKALVVLENLQDANGSYQSWGTTNSESAAQVIVALTSLNIDPEKDYRFDQVLVNLLTYYNEQDGGFKHVLTETKSNGMATEQAAYTLAAYNRLLSGKTKLYDMTDTKGNQQTQTNEATPQPSAPIAISFSDTQTHWAKEDIEAAVTKGLLKGYPDGTFKPDNYLTRGQATSILVRALHLKNVSEAPFTDISMYNKETQNEIAAAYEARLLIAKSGEFAPSAKISREELAIMLARAYALKNGEPYVPKEYAPFKDIEKLPIESQQAITFLYDFEIAQGSNGMFNPNGSTTRAHAAKMFINFLKVVEK